MGKKLHVYKIKLKDKYADLLAGFGFPIGPKDFLVQHMFLDNLSFASKHKLRYFKWENDYLTTVLDRKIHDETFTNYFDFELIKSLSKKRVKNWTELEGLLA